jgi:hypothetical protein
MTRVLEVILCVTTLWPLLYTLWVWAADFTANWHTGDDGLPSDMQGLAVALPPNILCAGTWEEGIHRSTDLGATWQVTDTGTTLPMYVQGGLSANPVTPLSSTLATTGTASSLAGKTAEIPEPSACRALP